MTLLLMYLLIGPLAWGLFAFGMVKGRKRMSLLKRPAFALPAPAPPVSVLVPVKDEAAQIETCLASVLALKYPGQLQVIAIDDRSSDGTGAILDRLARIHPCLTVLHVRAGDLPDGWAGKCHALHVGMRHATGEWLLFVDSDVLLAPDVLAACVALSHHKRFDLISLLPSLEARSFWERLIVPLAGGATGAMYLLPMTNYNELPGTAFANGQFMCVRRSAYEAVGGHEAVRHTLSEDVALARRLKRNGFRPRLAIGTEWASTRMYSSPGAILRGWSRNFLTGSDGRPWRVLAAVAFVVLCCLTSYATVASGATGLALRRDPSGAAAWLCAGLAHLSIMTIALAAMYRWTGNPRRYAILFPLGGAMLIAIWVRTLWMCLTGRVEWRGTSYAHRIGRGVVAQTR